MAFICDRLALRVSRYAGLALATSPHILPRKRFTTAVFDACYVGAELRSSERSQKQMNACGCSFLPLLLSKLVCPMWYNFFREQ